MIYITHNMLTLCIYVKYHSTIWYYMLCIIYRIYHVYIYSWYWKVCTNCNIWKHSLASHLLKRKCRSSIKHCLLDSLLREVEVEYRESWKNCATGKISLLLLLLKLLFMSSLFFLLLPIIHQQVFPKLGGWQKSCPCVPKLGGWQKKYGIQLTCNIMKWLPSTLCNFRLHMFFS